LGRLQAKLPVMNCWGISLRTFVSASKIYILIYNLIIFFAVNNATNHRNICGD